METLRLRRDPAFVKPSRGTFPEPQLDPIDGEVTIIDDETDEIVAVQAILPEADLLTDLRQHLRFRLKFDVPARNASNGRLSGIKAITRTFGYAAPNPLRNQRWGAQLTRLHEDPDLDEMMKAATAMVWDSFVAVAPERAEQHRRIVEEIHRDWWFAGEPFTSGIINKASVLPYHVDRGNIVGSWSAMLVLRRAVEGGRLHLPEWGVTLGVVNRSVTIFNGQSMWHGVTPLVASPNSYRFSMVWYAKSFFKKCGSREDELHRAAVASTERKM